MKDRSGLDGDKKYQLIYADPPWTYRDKCNAGKRGAGHKYTTMTIEDLCAMPISAIASDNCLLAMWWVAPMPIEAISVVEAWGFKLKTMKGFTWAKTTKHGKDHFGMGNWTRANSEDCLIATRGKPLRINKGVRQLIHAPIGRHSEKPFEARDRLVLLIGDVPRIELFSRVRSDGWDYHGDEILCDSPKS